MNTKAINDNASKQHCIFYNFQVRTNNVNLMTLIQLLYYCQFFYSYCKSSKVGEMGFGELSVPRKFQHARYPSCCQN